MRPFDLFIDGEDRPAEGGRTAASLDPSTGEPWAEVAAASVADVRRAVDSASAAFGRREWADLPVEARALVLERIAELVFERQDELVDVEMADAGGTLRWATTANIPATAQTFQSFATLLREQVLEEAYEEEVPVPSRNLITREPYGVVAAIVPWNFPLASAAWKVAPALAAGNSLVLKPSPLTPCSALLLARICADAGVPPGVFNVVCGPEDALGEALVRHPAVRKIAFTGSTPVGKHITRLAAERLVPVSLELGGKSPDIFLEDADLDIAIPGALFGTFFHSGQICTSGTRLLVPRARHDEIVERLVEQAGRIRVGDPKDPDTNMGPLISAGHRSRVDGYVRLGREEGARCVTGGSVPKGLDRGYYYAPTILTGVNNAMRVAREEIFGPVVCVIPYDDEAEALRIANDSDFGLAAAIWSRDEVRALRLARRIEAGTVWINDYHLLSPRFPFGGYKQSGAGRELGRAGLEDYSQLKHIHVGQSSTLEEKHYFAFTIGDA